MNLGSILGTATSKDTALIVESILSQTWRETFTTRDIRVLVVALTATATVVAVQALNSMIVHSKNKSWSWGKIILMLCGDILLFAGLVVGQLRMYNWVGEIKAPRSVVYERLNPVLVNIRWKTYDPEASIVYWGYGPDRLDQIEMGMTRQVPSREHETLLDVEPGREVYFQIRVGSNNYGINQMLNGNPYGVTSVVEEENE